MVELGEVEEHGAIIAPANLKFNLRLLSAETIRKILAARSHPLTARAEDLSVDDWIYVCTQIKQLTQP